MRYSPPYEDFGMFKRNKRILRVYGVSAEVASEWPDILTQREYSLDCEQPKARTATGLTGYPWGTVVRRGARVGIGAEHLKNEASLRPGISDPGHCIYFTFRERDQDLANELAEVFKEHGARLAMEAVGRGRKKTMTVFEP
jgi:hypothetical protein